MQRDIEQVASWFHQDGYAVIKQLFSEAEVQAINQVYERYREELLESGAIDPDTMGGRYPRLRDYHKQNEMVLKFALQPKLLDFLERIVGEEVLLIATSYYFKSPGTKGLAIHQDNYAIGVSPHTTYAAWISLDKADSSNGGLIVVPGTHSMNLIGIQASEDVVSHFSDYGQEVPIPSGYSTEHVETYPGDVVLFSGNTLHGSSDNLSSNRFRLSLIIHFAAVSTNKLSLNYNCLYDKTGAITRRKLNSSPKITESLGSVFMFKKADYFGNNGWR